MAEAGQDRDGGPDRTSYVVTEAGRAHLNAWLSTVEPPAPFVTDQLFRTAEGVTP